MARIRTVKPELARHEDMFDAEKETGLPLRFAWAMLFTVADREGRFEWRPRALKSEVLPLDDVDFSRVLDAWLTRGFIQKYRVAGKWFGWIPTFTKHQVINNREAASDLPSIDDAEEITTFVLNDMYACRTREPRDDYASVTREVRAQGEGKGREGKGTGREEEQSSLRSDSSAPLALTPNPPPPPADLKASKAARILQIAEEAQEAYNRILAKPNGELAACAVLNKPRLKAVENCLPTARAICKSLYGRERVTPEFWQAYFETAEADDFHAGRKAGGPGHENWKPDFEFLLRESVMAKLFDRAMTEAAA